MRKKTDNFEHPQLNTPTTPGGSGANRRRFLQGAAGLGLSATALSGMFSDYVGSFSSVWAADYDPMKYAATKINMLVVGSENIDHAFRDLLPELQAETGIEVEITSPAIGPLIQKTVQILQAERSGFELIQYLGFLAPQVVGTGSFTQLNSFIDDPSETAPDWGFQDFIQAAVNNVGIYDVEAGKRGQGSDVYAIPSGPGGSGIYFYRKDLFEAAGLQPAKTWGRVPRGGEGTDNRRRGGCQLYRRQQFFACFDRLVHTFHHIRRRAHERQSGREEFHAAGRYARGHPCSAIADRSAAVCAQECHAVRLCRKRRRILDRKDRPR